MLTGPASIRVELTKRARRRGRAIARSGEWRAASGGWRAASQLWAVVDFSGNRPGKVLLIAARQRLAQLYEAIRNKAKADERRKKR